MADPNDLQRNYKEFLDLLPLTMSLAGLPHSNQGSYYTEDQIAARVFTVKHAYRAARTLMRECIRPESAPPANR
ncbi:MAG: hypothetical protein NT069_12335 [Planctomycetota bacterium]|nr:hypothetical protein [Planctomycetota bacterium]